MKKSIISLVLGVALATTASAVEFDTEVDFAGTGRSVNKSATGTMYYNMGSWDLAFGATGHFTDGDSDFDIDLGVRTELPAIGQASIILNINQNTDEEYELNTLTLSKTYSAEVADGVSLGAKLDLLTIGLVDDSNYVTVLAGISPVVGVNVELF